MRLWFVQSINIASVIFFYKMTKILSKIINLQIIIHKNPDLTWMSR